MNKEEYTKILDENQFKRPKCKCCGNDIYYNNSIARVSKANKNKGSVIFEGKTYKTVKSVNGIDYNLQVCQDCLLKEFPDIKNLSRTFNVMSKQTQFAFNIPDDVFESSREKYAMTKEHMIEKYGEAIGLEKWENYCKKQAETNTFEYKQQKYGMTKEEFDEYNSNRACTLENFVKRHGNKEGKRKWQEYCDRQSYTKSKEYILEKYGEEELQRILRDRLSSVENLDSIGYSKVSQVFFDSLDNILKDKYETYYKTKNSEYSIYSNPKYYCLDYYIKDLKIAIEFNGDYWHANPKKFNEDYINTFIGLTAKEIWQKDEERYKVLEEEFGIKTYVIWEDECNNGMTAKEFIKKIPELQYIFNEMDNN